jgi:TetR/AcrR family transcriptional regulator, transcriptional repressor for nem operon
MTDSPDNARGSKRERLIAGAADLLHRQGVLATTLAHVAQAADVPLGNVYYYFKTKDDLVQAVIDTRAGQVRALLEALEKQHRTPRSRLKALARSWVEMRELVARHGCPFGTLCMELDNRDDDLRAAAVNLVEIFLDWAENQFQQLGRRDARALAITLFGGVQGAAQLTNTLRDPEIMAVQVRQLERWIDSVKRGR